MHLELEHVQRCVDIGAMQAALHTLCAPFGAIVQLDILPAAQAGRQYALCFLRLATAEQESLALEGLPLARASDRLVLILDLASSAHSGAHHA